MEIGIPLIALGGMYIIANKDKANKANKANQINKQKSNQIVEGLTNTSNNYQPKANIMANNYGVADKQEKTNYIQPQQPQPVENNDYLLDDSKYKKETLQHNNMVPFNGSKVRGAVFDYNGHESILDNKVGNGSTTIRKQEQAPLFKPEDNMNLNYGSQNHSDFYQSRVVSGSQKPNIKPFESKMVGPGLDKGYNTEGTGGFNSGMEAREKWRPYTIDEMRVKTNPKIEYDLLGHEGPAYSHIKTTSTKENLGKFEKNRPDTYFENGQERWLKTTSSEKAPTYRSEQQMGNVKRGDKDTNYKGHAISDKKGPYAKQTFEQPKRNILATNGVTNSTATGKGPNADHELPFKSHTNYMNNRASTKHETTLGGIGGAFGAVVAPLIDLFKPTLKEEVISNIRVFGDAKASVSGNYTIDYNDKTKTTNKETTLYSPNFNINNQGEASYVNTHRPTDVTQRNETCTDYVGGATSNYGMMNYDNAYLQTNNEVKSSTINNRPNQGGTQMLNHNINVRLANKDSNVSQNRTNAPHKANYQTPSIQTQGTSNYSRESPDVSQTRMDGDLLKGFRENPYTHSLSSHA
jgi:hypothetical protein